MLWQGSSHSRSPVSNQSSSSTQKATKGGQQKTGNGLNALEKLFILLYRGALLNHSRVLGETVEISLRDLVKIYLQSSRKTVQGRQRNGDCIFPSRFVADLMNNPRDGRTITQEQVRHVKDRLVSNLTEDKEKKFSKMLYLDLFKNINANINATDAKLIKILHPYIEDWKNGKYHTGSRAEFPEDIPVNARVYDLNQATNTRERAPYDRGIAREVPEVDSCHTSHSVPRPSFMSEQELEVEWNAHEKAKRY